MDIFTHDISIYIYTYMYIHMFYNNIFEYYRDVLCDDC